MDKKSRSYELESLKQTFSNVESLGGRVTNSAFKGAQELGFSRQVIVEVIQSLRAGHFYKSMTSYADHQVWQDVYHARYESKEIYLKFTTKADGTFLLISFKEK